MALCINCGRIPVPKDRSRTLCKPCLGNRNQLCSEEKRRSSARRAQASLTRYWKLLHYKGSVLGLTLQEDKSDEFGNVPVTVAYIKEVDSVAELPKTVELIDLDHYCEGLTRIQVRGMKRIFNRLAPVWKSVKIRKVSE